RQRRRGGVDAARRQPVAERRPDTWRLGWPVRPPPRVRDDLSEPHHLARLRHPDEGEVAGAALRHPRALSGRRVHELGRRTLRPPRRHARRLPDAALLARTGTVRPPLTPDRPQIAPHAGTAR